jgi:hypothetical protein
MTDETKPTTSTAPSSTQSANTQQPTAKVNATTTAAKPAAKVSVPKSAATPKKRPGKAVSKRSTAPAAAGKSKSGNTAKPAKDSKPKKVKMVRDSYTMPENDYARLADLKKKCLKAGVHVKKSELLRAGLIVLAKLPIATLQKTVGQLEKIKTGRPGKL